MCVNCSSLVAVPSTPPPPSEIPFTSPFDANLPVRFHIPVKVLVLPQVKAVLHSPAGLSTAKKEADG